MAEWDKIRSQIQKWAADQGFVVNVIQPIVAYVQGERSKLVDSKRKSDSDYLKAFVQRTGLDERTAALGKEIVDLV